MSKICNKCEAIFNDNYTKCPSCKSKNMKRYLPPAKQKKQVEEVKEVKNFEFIEPFVVDGDIDDFGSM